jgi:hypothetical protein
MSAVWVVVIRGKVMGVYSSQKKADSAVTAHPTLETVHVHGPCEVQ